MPFLADLGRSGSVGDFLKEMRDRRNEMRQNRALDLQAQGMELKNKELEHMMNIANEKRKEAQKKNEPVFLESVKQKAMSTYGFIPPELDMLEQHARRRGLVSLSADGRDFVERGYMDEISSNLNAPQHQLPIAKSYVNLFKKQRADLMAAIDNQENPLKGKELQEAQEKLSAATQELDKWSTVLNKETEKFGIYQSFKGHPYMQGKMLQKYGRSDPSVTQMPQFGQDLQQWAIEEIKANQVNAETILPEQIEFLKGMNPNERYSKGWKTEKTGALALDINGKPIKLGPPLKYLGKRGAEKDLRLHGEMYNDLSQIRALLQNDTVRKDLERFRADLKKDPTLLERAGNSIANALGLWMQQKGVAENSLTTTLRSRISRMASEERKTFAGTAVSEAEFRALLGWMPTGGEGLQVLENKARVLYEESKEKLTRFLDLHAPFTNMSEYYTQYDIAMPWERNRKTPLDSLVDNL